MAKDRIDELIKIGRLPFTPVLRSTGERLDLEVDHDFFPRSKAMGYHGSVQDLKSGQWYAIYGKECDIPGCNCAAWVEEITPPSSKEILREWWDTYRKSYEHRIEAVEQDAMRRGDSRKELIYLEQTDTSAPVQWEGRTADDRPVIIRGKDGIVSVHVGPMRGSLHDAARQGEIAHISHETADTLSTMEMVCLLSNVFDFTRLKKIISTD